MPVDWYGIVSQYLNRRFSEPLAKFLATHSGVTPNQLTIVSFLIGVASAGLYYLANPWLGGLLAQVSSVVDGVDGDLAHIRGLVTPFGGFLDSTLDRLVDGAIIAGMTHYAIVFHGNSSALILGFTALMGSFMVSYTRAKSEKIPNFRYRSVISNYLANRDVRLFIIMVGSLLGFVVETLTLLTILTGITVTTRVSEAYTYCRASKMGVAIA